MELRGHLVPPAARRIEELQHSLQKKDADLRAMEERYRRYVDKARTVRTLLPHRPPAEATACIGSCLCQFAPLLSSPAPVMPFIS